MKAKNLPQKLTVDCIKSAYKKGMFKPLELIQAIVKRSEETVDFNVWITPPSLEWIKPYLDDLEGMDPDTHPLWGIPFAIKDNIDLAGVPTTAGCPDFSYQPEESAVVVARLIEAGAIPVGKTNLDQFATGLVGTRSPYGEAKNALNPELISGGSSSGSAVAVALELAAFALGTDTAGSGRVPAALHGLIGFKSSLGAWPTKGVVPACASLDCVTVFSHTLEEALLVDGVVRGEEETDPWSRLVKRKASARPEKVLVPKEALTFFGTFGDGYQAAWQATLEQLEGLGIRIETIDTAYLSETAAVLYDGPWVAERWADLGPFVESHPGCTHPVTEKVLRSGARSELDAASVFRAMHLLQTYKKKAFHQLEQAVLVMPTAGGTWSRKEVEDNPILTNSQMGLYTNHCNLLDLCAVNVPGAEADVDLPFGITLFSRFDQEHLIAGFADEFLTGTRAPHSRPQKVEIAVCGLHMKGFPLERQMIEHGATFVRRDFTAPSYKMLRLKTVPEKPGLIKVSEDGCSIEVEVWEMLLDELGSFTQLIPAPLGIGKVELEDGREIEGFICEQIAWGFSEDITDLGGWRYAMEERV